MSHPKKDVLQAFLRRYNRRHTQRAYRYDLVDFFGKDSISASDVEAVAASRITHYLQKQRAEGFSNGTIKRRLVSIRTFFAWLVDKGVVESNPATDVELP